MTSLSKLKEKLTMANIKTILFRLAIFAGLFIAIVLIINLSIFDEELDPEIVELLKPTPEPSANENAYYAFWGIAAASDKEMMESGINLVRRYLNNREEKHLDKLTEQDYIEILGGENLDKDWMIQYPSCISIREYGCLTKMKKRLEDKPIEDPRLMLMLERYDTITKISSYKHSINLTVAAPLPYYGHIMQLSQIDRASAYQSSNFPEFIEKINADMKFWKRILLKENTLLGKMVAIAALWSNLQYLSEYISLHPVSEKDKLKVQKLLHPLTKSELDISLGFDGEIKYISDFLINKLPNNFKLSQENILAISPLLQSKTSVNVYYHNFFKPMKELSKIPVDKFIQYFYKCNKESLDLTNNCIRINNTSVSFSSPSSLYNLAGKLIMPTTFWSGEDYIARAHDLNGMIRLVNLQLSLKSVDTKLTEQAIKNSEFNNPYTGKPMEYDQENNWLKFDCLETNSVCQVKL